MAENGTSTNGHRPARRRKHIYPPLEQMAAQQAASAQRQRTGSGGSRTAVRDVVPEATPPPAAPAMAAQVMAAAPRTQELSPMPAVEARSMGANGTASSGDRARRRKHIYPPAEQMAAEQAAAQARRQTHTGMTTMSLSPASESSAVVAGDDDAALGDADRVELRLSAVGMVDAGDVQFAQGALGAARADSVSVEQGAVGAAVADKVELSRGYARSILARQVQLDNAAARMVIAADVKAERTAIMFLVARRVTGDVRVLFDWRGAVAFGAIAGIVMGLLRRRPKAGE